MDIKPCPFCSGLDSHTESCYFTVKEKMINGYASVNECHVAWNTRHIPEGYALVRVEPNKDDLIIQSWTSNPTNGWSLSVPNGIKITHITTGFTAFCESERSQHKNREIAMAEIKAMIAAAKDETE